MPPKKNQVNGFWLFAQGNKGKWKAQGLLVGTNQQLLAVASQVWKSMSTDERKQWDARAKAERKDKSQNQDYERLDNLGQVISMRRDPMEETRKRREREIGETTSAWKGKDLTEEKFYFIDFQDLCDVTEEHSEKRQWLPREMAVVEYCLRHGITNTYHQFIWPGGIPLGFRLQAEQKSEEFHKIPIHETEHDSSDYAAIFTGAKDILSEGKTKGTYSPVYCLNKDYEKIKFLCDWLWIQSGGSLALNNPLGKVHSLEDLATQLLLHSGSPSVQTVSTYTIMRQLDGTLWDYISATACDYHKELDVTRFCSLSIVRKIAFTMSDMLAEHYNIQLSGKHVPVKEEIEAPAVQTLPHSWAPARSPGVGRGRGRKSSPHTPEKVSGGGGGGGGKTYYELARPRTGRESDDTDDQEKDALPCPWGSPWKQFHLSPSAGTPEKASSETYQEDDFPDLQMSGMRISDEPFVGGRGRGAPAARPPPGFNAVSPARGGGFTLEGASVRATLPAGHGGTSRSSPPAASQNPALGRGRSVGRGAMPPGGAQGRSLGRGRMPEPLRGVSQFEADVLGPVGQGYKTDSSAAQVMNVAPQQTVGPRWQLPPSESEAYGAGGGVSNCLSSAVPSFSRASVTDRIVNDDVDNFEPSLEAEFPSLQSSAASGGRGVNFGMGRGVNIGRGSMRELGRGSMQGR